MVQFDPPTCGFTPSKVNHYPRDTSTQPQSGLGHPPKRPKHLKPPKSSSFPAKWPTHRAIIRLVTLVEVRSGLILSHPGS